MKKVLILIILGVLAFAGFYFWPEKEIANYPSLGTDIIAFGDSLVEGVGATDGKNLISVLEEMIGEPIVNLGKSGDTTRDGLERINELDKHNPKVVILLLGGNDFLRKIPVSETRKNLSKIIENIQNKGAVVLLVGVRGGILTDSFSAEFEELRDKYQTAYVSNVLRGLLGNKKYMADPIHPNDEGYALIANRIYPVLKELVK